MKGGREGGQNEWWEVEGRERKMSGGRRKGGGGKGVLVSGKVIREG